MWLQVLRESMHISTLTHQWKALDNLGHDGGPSVAGEGHGAVVHHGAVVVGKSEGPHCAWRAP